MRYCDVPIRIRYAETDKMGISYYANYLVWFEAARSELFRALGLPYTEIEKKGIILPVAEAHCKYFHSTFYDELIYVRVSVSHCKMTSMRFTYQILPEAKDVVAAWGYTVHVFVGQDRTPLRVPPEVRAAITVHELKEKQIDNDA